MVKGLVSVIIPTWNGEGLLRKNLPLALKALPEKCEVIVIENGSEDNSAQYLKKLAQSDSRLKLVLNTKNLGFIKSCNQGSRLAKGEFLALLNNDVIPLKGFLKPALNHFKDPQVFAVSFREVQNKWGSWARIFWRGGYFNYLPGERASRAHISGWASGGSALFRKSMWEELGGLDRLYEPFYWEDLDLSYRAWKKGWKIIWEPNSRINHKHASTISRFDKWYVALIRERNQLLFIWKNIQDPILKITHFWGKIFRVLTGPNYLKVIFAARKRYREFEKSKADPGIKTDRQILQLFKK